MTRFDDFSLKFHRILAFQAFMRRLNFVNSMLSRLEHERSISTSRTLVGGSNVYS